MCSKLQLPLTQSLCSKKLFGEVGGWLVGFCGGVWGCWFFFFESESEKWVSVATSKVDTTLPFAFSF